MKTVETNCYISALVRGRRSSWVAGFTAGIVASSPSRCAACGPGGGPGEDTAWCTASTTSSGGGEPSASVASASSISATSGHVTRYRVAPNENSKQRPRGTTSEQHYANNVNVNAEFKVTLHEQVRSPLQRHLTVLKVTVCHTAGHRGEEYDD